MTARAEALGRVTRVLCEAGATEEAIRAALADDVVDLLAVDVLILPSRRAYTPLQLSEETGLPLDALKQLWRALGFLDPADDDPVLTETDVAAARDLQRLLALGVTELDAALQLARVIGSSMARVAEASLLRGADALGADDDSVLAADAFASVAAETIPAMARLLEFVWRRHTQAVARRTVGLRSASRQSGVGPVLCVGFADMVGFTFLSQHLHDDELARVVRRFEEISFDIVGAHGGRVVKTIGDEVMFVVDDPLSAARIAVGLAEAYADDELLSDVRVGLASGSVLVRDGDYFGPTVNLASRIVQIADPGSVLVSDDFHRLVEQVEPAEFTGRPLHPRSLKDVGRVQLWSCRRVVDEDDTTREVRRRARRERLARVLGDLEELRDAGQRFITGPGGR